MKCLWWTDSDTGKITSILNVEAIDYVMVTEDGLGCKVAMRNGHINVFANLDIAEMKKMLGAVS